MNNLLPPNATAQEVALSETTERIDGVPVRARFMWDPQTCPANLLPWLAWACSVDEWNPDWSEQQRRDTISASFEIHSTKGTLAAVKVSLAALGYDTTITEWFQLPAELAPYTFRADIDAGTSPIAGDLITEATQLINQTKNTRSHLARLRVASSAPVEMFAAAAQIYGVYCATGGTLSVVGGRPKLLKANALALASASGTLTSAIVRYFATSHGDGGLQIWKVDGTTFTAVPDPSIKPGDGGANLTYSLEFSPGAQYMVIACNSDPKLYFYKRTGDNFTKLADPAVVPAGPAGGGARFSPDGNFVAVTHTSGGFLSIYSRSGDTFTKITNPATVIATNGTAVAWNSNGDYLAAAGFGQEPFVYKRTGSSFDKIGFPSTALPIYAKAMAFSPISDLLVCGHNGSPYISVSSIAAEVHTRHSDPAVPPTSTVNAVAFNHDGTLVAVGTNGAPYFALYSVSGTTLTKLANPSIMPGSSVYTVAFNAEGTVLTVGEGTAPYLTTYAVSGTTLTQIGNPGSLPANSVRGIDFS